MNSKIVTENNLTLTKDNLYLSPAKILICEIERNISRPLAYFDGELKLTKFGKDKEKEIKQYVKENIDFNEKLKILNLWGII